MKELNLNLILYGSTETVYVMKCEIVNKTHNDLKLGEKIYEYLESNESYKYHLIFKNAKGLYDYQEYVSRVAIFTGQVAFEYYTDKAMKNRLKKK